MNWANNRRDPDSINTQARGPSFATCNTEIFNNSAATLKINNISVCYMSKVFYTPHLFFLATVKEEYIPTNHVIGSSLAEVERPGSTEAPRSHKQSNRT